jgi:hypothetical protein
LLLKALKAISENFYSEEKAAEKDLSLHSISKKKTEKKKNNPTLLRQ